MTIFVIFFLAFNFIGVNGKETACSSECFVEDQSTDCNTWFEEDGQDKRIPKQVYQYNPKGQKCVQLSCKSSSGIGIMASESECLEKCRDCGLVLKNYKFDDECLKPVNMGIELKEVNGKIIEETSTKQQIFHSFNVKEGKCGAGTPHRGGNWVINRGVALPTLEECNKRCPSIK